MAVIAALSLFAAVPAAAQAKTKKIITISGSTSVFPLETQLARAWIKTKKGKKYGFRILQGGSNVGISDVSSGSIDPIGRAPTSGTHDAFRNIFLGGTNQGSFVAAKASNGLVQQGVQSDPRGIGYVSLAFTSGVHVIQYNGVDCTLRNAASFQYGGVRSFYFVTRGAPVGGVKKFIGWVLGNKKANNIIGSDWVPLH